MINSAEEFWRLFHSSKPEDRLRLKEPAADDIWLDVVRRYPEMEVEVIKNHTISGVVLEALARSRDPDIRFEVAMKRRNTRRAFELLAEDDDASVRHRVACNPKTPADILRRLSLDFDEQVSLAAKKRI